jgi:DNA-binding transcriptional MerR regulator
LDDPWIRKRVHDRGECGREEADMNPFISDDRLMRTQLEDRLRRAEDARLADAARRARKTRSLSPAVEAKGSRRELGPEASWRLALATPVLRDQGMPPEEIDAILGADDPEVIRRYLELHRERLEERLADQRRTISRLIQVTTSSRGDRRRPATRWRGGMRLVSLSTEKGTGG